MSEFNLLAATRTLEKSMPFVLYRFLLCFGIGLGYLLATLGGAGTLVGFASLTKNANALGPIGAVLGFAAFGFLMYKLRPSWLHGVKAPHLAVLAAQAKGEPLPSGMALVEFAKQRLAQSFPSKSRLFELDRSLQHTLADMAGSAFATRAPAGGPWVTKVLAAAVRVLYSRNHQSILAWHFYSNAEDSSQAAATALAAQKAHFAALLKYRIYATVFEMMGFAAALPLLTIAFQKMVAGIPIAVGMWPYVFGAVFAWTLKAAFFEPIAEAALMESFFPLVEEDADPARNPAAT